MKIGTTSNLIAIVDNDVMLLHSFWETLILLEFSDPTVGAWGAGWMDPRVIHASMLVMRGDLFQQIKSFYPEGNYDTGGLACWQIEQMGYRLVRVPVDPKPWALHRTARTWHHWVHLGGGTHSDWTQLTWLQRIKRIRRIYERKKFLRAGWRWLETYP